MPKSVNLIKDAAIELAAFTLLTLFMLFCIWVVEAATNALWPEGRDFLFGISIDTLFAAADLATVIVFLSLGFFFSIRTLFSSVSEVGVS